MNTLAKGGYAIVACVALVFGLLVGGSTNAANASAVRSQSAVTAVTAAGCSMNGCDGLGPVTEHCDDDAVKLDTSAALTGYPHDTVELQFSPSCLAFWARTYFNSMPGEDGDPGYETIWISRYVINEPDNLTAHVGYKRGPCACYDWGGMMGGYPGRMYRACVVDHHGGTYDGQTRCTSWFNRFGNPV